VTGLPVLKHAASRVADRIDEQRIALAVLVVALLPGQAESLDSSGGTKAHTSGDPGNTLGSQAQLPWMIGPSVQFDPHEAGGLETFTQSRAWAAVGTRTRAFAGSRAFARPRQVAVVASVCWVAPTRRG